MLIVIAYVLVVPLVQFCYTIGVYLGGIPIAFLLIWTSISVRTKVAGFIGGVVGVVSAVAFGYGIFRFVGGPESFTVGAFFASTVPLLFPIRNDFLHLQQVNAARQELLATVQESSGDDVVKAMTAETKTAHGSGVVGGIAGLTLVTVWFFCL